MYSLEEIKARSHSDNEIVLNYIDAMELLYLFGESQTKIYGYEGRILYPSGKLGHSTRYRGSADLGTLPTDSAIALIKSQIMQANWEWDEKPVIPGGELLFCITAET
jgi:hypothetical protein